MNYKEYKKGVYENIEEPNINTPKEVNCGDPILWGIIIVFLVAFAIYCTAN